VLKHEPADHPLHAWIEWVASAILKDDSRAALRPVIDGQHQAGGWHEPEFWPALLRLYDEAQARTEQPSVAVAKTLKTSPNAARTWIYRARKKHAEQSTSRSKSR
jgi:hypothetical protein